MAGKQQQEVKRFYHPRFVPHVENIGWKCDICDKDAPFQVEFDKHYCAEHWRLTGHFAGIQAGAVMLISDQEENKGGGA